jgi:hypothetical protein
MSFTWAIKELFLRVQSLHDIIIWSSFAFEKCTPFVGYCLFKASFPLASQNIQWIFATILPGLIKSFTQVPCSIMDAISQYDRTKTTQCKWLKHYRMSHIIKMICIISLSPSLNIIDSENLVGFYTSGPVTHLIVFNNICFFIKGQCGPVE